MEIRLYDVVEIGDVAFDRLMAIYFLKDDTCVRTAYVEELKKYQVIVAIDNNFLQTWCDKVVTSNEKDNT